ncbi:MAG TPA: hypothetical protein EYO22_06795 [Candidatus Poseidoniales archaeon]|nr:hypothetical protein [Candidatus Poseidoniales archaeon]
MRKNHLMALLMVTTLLILPLNHQMNPVGAESTSCEGLSCANSWSGSVDQVVVLRESTAIWCEVCAEVDPVISDFIEERPDQVTRIAFHPDDGIDYLGNRLSTQQSWKMGQNPLEAAYPTIWMGDQQATSGLISKNTLHKQFLASAGTSQQEISVITHNRSSYGDVQDDYWSLEIRSHLPTTMNGTYTFIISEDRVEIEYPASYNGIKFHAGVARAGVVINSSTGEIIFSEPVNSWILGNISNPSGEQTFINLTYQFPYHQEHISDNSKLTIIAENSIGQTIAAATTPKFVVQSNPTFSSTAKIGLSLMLVGLLLASPLLNSRKMAKTELNEKVAAESEE